MATKQLILLRHAKSDWHSGTQNDHDRPLNHRGRKDAPEVGSWLNSKGILPDCIICSSAVRTRETLQLVLEIAEWGEVDCVFEEAMYHASEDVIVNIIYDNLISYDRLLIVGHNPSMDMVLLRFCPNVTPNVNHKLMTTGSVAVIEFNDEHLTHQKLIEFARPGDTDV